jgi:hypothetical protein
MIDHPLFAAYRQLADKSSIACNSHFGSSIVTVPDLGEHMEHIRWYFLVNG